MLVSDGYEILKCDESLFNPDHFEGRHWAQARSPIMKTSKYTMLPKIVCCGVISPSRGRVYYHYGERSFNAQDIMYLLREVRLASGPNAKLAIFWDNCRIHISHAVREFAITPEINIQLVRNIPYSPHLNGIERLWQEAKRRYRSTLDWIKAHNRRFNSMALVQHIMDGIPDEFVAQQARHGENSINRAHPIMPLEVEMQAEGINFTWPTTSNKSHGQNEDYDAIVIQDNGIQ